MNPSPAPAVADASKPGASPTPLKICHLNTFDTVGGAARSAYRVHLGVSRLGCDSSMFVRVAASKDPAVQLFTPSTKRLARFRRRLRRKIIKHEFESYRASRPPYLEPFSDCRSEYGDEVAHQLPSADILHLHWVANAFVDYPSFFSTVPAQTPVVWTLHDMNLFTGGCHYDQGCGRFAERCGSCPQLGSSDPNDLSAKIWKLKHQAFARLPADRLHIVTPSHWLAAEVKRSSLTGRFPISVIPYGLDLNEFAPRDRGHSREVLGLPQNARVVLFLADGVNNARKGFNFLAEAMQGLEKLNNIVLLSLGRNKPQFNVSVPWVHLEPINNDRFLSIVYSAADLFVIPSLQDNLPNTVLEAMACGTPTVGFATGGIPEMVRPGKTGVLVPPRDVPALRAAIAQLLQDPTQLAELTMHCRRIAREEYAWDIQARRYLDLYAALHQSGRPAPTSTAKKGLSEVLA